MDHPFEPIRYRADGSIDTAFYIARSRQMRGDQAAHLASAVTRPVRRGLWQVLLQAAGLGSARAADA